MKKILLVVLSLFLVIGLVACNENTVQSYTRKRKDVENVITPPIAQKEIQTTVAYANWIDSEVAFEGDENCLNLDKYVFSDFPRLPFFKFDSKSELDEFKNKYKDVFTMDHGYNEIPSFNDVTANYDDEFFKNYSLMLTYIEASSGSFRYGITDVKKENGTLILRVEKLNNPEVYTDDMAGWLLMAEVEKEYFNDCTSFDAQLWYNHFENDIIFESNGGEEFIYYERTNPNLK